MQAESPVLSHREKTLIKDSIGRVLHYSWPLPGNSTLLYVLFFLSTGGNLTEPFRQALFCTQNYTEGLRLSAQNKTVWYQWVKDIIQGSVSSSDHFWWSTPFFLYGIFTNVIERLWCSMLSPSRWQNKHLIQHLVHTSEEAYFFVLS